MIVCSARALDVGRGLVDPPDGQQQVGPIREQPRIGDGRRRSRNAVEGPLEIAAQIGLERLAHHPLPVRSGRELIRPEIQDRRVIERPLDGIARPRDHPEHRRFAGLGDRRLTTGERQASSRVLREDCPLEDCQQRPVGFDTDQELRSADAGDSERRLHFQAARAPAEEVRGASQQIHHARALVLDRFDRHLGVGVQPEHRLIEHGEVRSAAIPDPDRVAGCEGVIQLDGLPWSLPWPPRVDSTLDRHGPGDRATRRLRRYHCRMDQADRDADHGGERSQAPGASSSMGHRARCCGRGFRLTIRLPIREE